MQAGRGLGLNSEYYMAGGDSAGREGSVGGKSEQTPGGGVLVRPT